MLMVSKQTYGEILKMNDIFFYVNGKQKNRNQNFADERHHFHIHGTQRNRWRNFLGQGHLIYIEPPWYVNKHMANFNR